MMPDVMKKFFYDDGKVKFAYLFGSSATGGAGPLSDIDIAVYLDESVDLLNYRLKLHEKLAKYLKSENFDLVILNDAPILLCYEVVKNGVILKDNRTERVVFETQVLYNYLDTAYLRTVQNRYVKRKIAKGEYFG